MARLSCHPRRQRIVEIFSRAGALVGILGPGLRVRCASTPWRFRRRRREPCAGSHPAVHHHHVGGGDGESGSSER